MLNSTQHFKDELHRFHRKTGTPAVGAGVVTANDATWFDVTGVCARGDHQPADLAHAWHLGSCAKAITATLYAILVDKQLASWNTCIGDVFTDIEHVIHKDWLNTRLEDLFFCRAGMIANPPVRLRKALMQDQRALPSQRTDMAILGMTPAPKRVGKFKYSNQSYMVLAAAIDRITAGSYEQALSEHVLSPLNITSLGYGPPTEIYGHSALINLFPLAFFKGKPRDPQDIGSDNGRVFSGAGTLHMTLPDWGRFIRVFLNDAASLLKPQTVTHLLHIPDGNQMGFGWGCIKHSGISHAAQGSNTMWAATAMLSDDRNYASLVVCNDGRIRVLGQSANLAIRLLDIAQETHR